MRSEAEWDRILFEEDVRAAAPEDFELLTVELDYALNDAIRREGSEVDLYLGPKEVALLYKALRHAIEMAEKGDWYRELDTRFTTAETARSGDRLKLMGLGADRGPSKVDTDKLVDSYLRHAGEAQALTARAESRGIDPLMFMLEYVGSRRPPKLDPMSAAKAAANEVGCALSTALRLLEAERPPKGTPGFYFVPSRKRLHRESRVHKRPANECTHDP